MPFCSFAQSAAMFDMTPIENLFLLEYLLSTGMTDVDDVILNAIGALLGAAAVKILRHK